MIAIQNIIYNNEIKTKNLKRRDFITKTLIVFAKKIKDDNFEWIKYENFKKEESNIIKKELNTLNINAFADIINSINEIEINQNNDNSNNKLFNNSFDSGEKCSNLNDESSDKEEHNNNNSETNEIIFDISENNSNNSFNDELSEDSAEINDILEEILVDKDKKDNLLLDRLLKNEDFNRYEEIIKEAINSRTKKRSEVTNDEEDIKESKKLLKKDKKVKFRYPKD